LLWRNSIMFIHAAFGAEIDFDVKADCHQHYNREDYSDDLEDFL
jgi:hypothetical protein